MMGHKPPSSNWTGRPPSKRMGAGSSPAGGSVSHPHGGDVRQADIVRWAMAISAGGEEAGVAIAEIARLIPIEWNGDEIFLDGAVRTGIMVGMDPVNIAVCLMFAMVGMEWPFLFPDVLPAVSKEWSRRVREGRSAARKPTSPSARMPQLLEIETGKEP